jgi:hypothetical protein
MAEIAHRAVMRPRAAIFELRVLFARELRLREGREYELAPEAQIVERLSAVALVERAERSPALGAADDVRPQLRRADLVLACVDRLGDGLLGELACAAKPQARQRLPDIGIGVDFQPIEGFHDMAIGIAANPFARIGHQRISLSFVPFFEF